MSNTNPSPLKFSATQRATSTANTDLVVIVTAPNTASANVKTITITNFANTPGVNHRVNNLEANTVTLRYVNTPANSGDVPVGNNTIFFDSNYLYINIDGTLKRIPLQTF